MSIHFHAECIDQRFGRGTFGRNAGLIEMQVQMPGLAQKTEK